MKHCTIASFLALGLVLFAGSVLASYDCSGLPEWKRQAYYVTNTTVQYLGIAYIAETNTKRDVPGQGYPWRELAACAPPDDGGGGSGSNSISIYGAWLCGNDYCTWSTERDTDVNDEFDIANHWIIDRGDGRPSVNLVVLSFVQPLKLLEGTTDDQTLNGVPRGMTQEVVDYFKRQGIRVMLSIGGITYVDAWNQALAQNATQLGLNAAAVAQQLGVGIEIDYEENTNPNLAGLQAFISAYRSVHPYCDSSQDAAACSTCMTDDQACKRQGAARLTIDLAAGDRWLIGLTQKATADWLRTDIPVLDYANAMVPARQPSTSAAKANWQEHIDGKPQYAPPIPPLAPAKFTGSLWLTGRQPLPECVNFNNSLQKSTGGWVQTVQSKIAGTTPGMLGFMFWAAECEGTRTVCTTPPNSCEKGMGAAATFYNIPIPMQRLRQQ